MTLHGVTAVTLPYFNEFGKPAFQRGLAMRILSVRPSVCQTRDL